MIEQALAEYLLAQPQVTKLVEQQIYRGRRPQDGKANRLVVTINRTQANRIYHLTGEANVSETTLAVTVWGRGNNAQILVQDAFEEIRLVASSFAGEWNKQRVLGCTYEGEQETPTQPADASDNWVYAYGCVLRIHHEQRPSDLSPAPPFYAGRVLRLPTTRLLRLPSGKLLLLNVRA